MKKIFYFLFCGALLISCDGAREVTSPAIEISNINIDSGLAWQGDNTAPIVLQLSTNDNWVVAKTDTKSTPAWFDVSPMSGPAGTTNLTINPTSINDSDTDRTAYLHIKCGMLTQTIAITQKKKDYIFNSYTVDKAGSLGSMLSSEQKDTITRMRLFGNINASDFKTLRKLPKLEALDLSEVSVQEGGIPDYAFGSNGDVMAMVSLKKIILPKNISSIGDGAFYDCSSLNGELSIPFSVTSIGGWAFTNCIGLTGSLTIPPRVASIGQGAFSYTGFNGSLTLPEKLRVIEPCTFMYCHLLTGPLTLPANIESIGHNAFNNCSALAGPLVIPQKVTSIGAEAFKECGQITGAVEIPVGVLHIGEDAFSSCNRITKFQVHWVEPIAYASNMFPLSKTILVPSVSMELYKYREGWQDHFLLGY